VEISAQQKYSWLEVEVKSENTTIKEDLFTGDLEEFSNGLKDTLITAFTLQNPHLGSVDFLLQLADYYQIDREDINERINPREEE